MKEEMMKEGLKLVLGTKKPMKITLGGDVADIVKAILSQDPPPKTVGELIDRLDEYEKAKVTK